MQPLEKKLGGVLVCIGICLSSGFAKSDDDVSFSRDVLPLLADRCFHCHGPDADHRQADLRLDLQADATADRDGSPAIVPGDLEKSVLIERIMSEDEDLRMPPPDANRRPLTPMEVAVLTRWVREGAVWGQHWSFEPITKPVPPNIGEENLPAIDAFVQLRMREHGLEPSPPATKELLLRRVSLDLTGLPPTLAEIDAFLADDSPDAYLKVVNRLLASPHYGERMAWPWLDAARYADTGGYQGDPERSMWPWRDWVVGAINSNMPFDQFTVEQLAGDLMPDATQEQRLATGFNRNHMHNAEGGRIAEETRVENVFDRVETTGTVWLGLTLQCARCHDHKFDPTSNVDYFALFDFFNQTSEDGRSDRGIAVPPAMETTARDGNKVKVMVMDTVKSPRETRILVKGIYNDYLEKVVTANVPQMLPPLPDLAEDRRYNRLDLARWITAPENPLMARVTVNRFWQTFFGRGIVATPEDLGIQGAQPTHPDLLNWLAAEFMESGWDVKHIHRLIVTSETYQQSAQATVQHLDMDPSNLWLARSPRYRLPSWMLRDQALAASGLLVPTLGGPPVRPYQPAGIWAEATFGTKVYQLGKGDDLYRRSIYTFWRRIIGPTIFFDAAKRQTCEVKPNRTNTPLHALTTLNDVTYVETARALAERAMHQETAEQRVVWAFRTLLARHPSEHETTILLRRLAEYVEYYREHPEMAEQLLSVGESERSERLDSAEHAAYTAIANTLMNLDELLVRP
jgi:hypothetical protein